MMDEKKIKTEVVGVQMHMCTILMMIILPFLILMAFLTLLALLTPTYSNDGLILETNKYGEKLTGNENLIIENPNRQGLIKTGVVQKLEDDNNEISIPIIYRISRYFIFFPVSEENDSKDNINMISDTNNNQNYQDIYNTPEAKENFNCKNSNDKDNLTKTNEDNLNNSSIVQKGKDKLKSELTKQETYIDGHKFNFNNKMLPYDFINLDFSIPNLLICPKDGADLKLLIHIHSPVENFEERKAIRETWGRTPAIGAATYAFVVSIAANNNLDNKLKHESDTFKDIIQTDLADIKENDAAKSVMSLKWITKYCPKVEYIFKTNDDVFVNVPQIDFFIRESVTKEDRMYGFLFEDMKPERNPKNRDYISKEYYPYEYLPNYLATEGYIFSSKSVPILYETALKSSYLPIENIYFTGILAQSAGIISEDIPLFSSTFPDLRKDNKCEIVSYTFVFHPLSHQGLRTFWDDLKSTGFKCGNYIDNVRRLISKGNGLNSNLNERFVYALLAVDEDNVIHDNEDVKKTVKN